MMKDKMQPKPKTPKKVWTRKEIARELLIFAALVIGLLSFRSSILSHYNVPTGSMLPTILPGDHFLANQMAYGLRIPFSGFFIGQPEAPRRGDIVVFPSPIEDGVDLVKRVVGLGGELLEVRDGFLYIDGAPIQTEAVAGGEDGFDRFIERMPERDHYIQLDRRGPYLRHYGPVRIPKGLFFPMGDNRDHSGDGRVFGPVPIHQLRARASFILYSTEGFLQFRGERLGHPLYGIEESKSER